jgi:serine/threonine-protein kinase
MEYLDGLSLLSALAAAGTAGESAALPLPRALHIALQICDAVGEAHAQGIVHRDLKPENVMLVRRGDDPDYAKVLDFGIARLDWADRDMATQAGLIFGTAKYISPEGAEGQPVGPPADVYSIATILYQMLAGRTPFEGDSPVSLLVQHTHASPPLLRNIARASYVPAPLSAVIMANLAKKPAERTANARLFGRDLIAAARQSGLYPEEIATQSTLFSPANLGAVKLASRERTKALELSPELAARISSILTPAVESRVEPAPAPRGAMGSEPYPSSVREVELPALPPPSVSTTPIAAPAPPLQTIPASSPEALLHAPPSSSTPSGVPSSPIPDLDFDDDAPSEKARTGSTIQGTETTLESEPPGPLPRRARLSRLIAIVACALVATPLVIVGGRRLGGISAPASNEPTLEATLDEARDAMRRHAWDAPPLHNFKEITARGLERWPGSAKFVDLRREAAERMVADALGRKYGGDLPEAIRLVRLALEWNPDLTTAQHLAAELERGQGPDVAPAPSESAAVGEHASSKVPRRGGRESKGRQPRAPAPSAKPSGAGAVVPPPPPPAPADQAPPPAPPSTGPWL